MEACTPSHDQTLRKRNLLRQNKLTPEVITMIMQEEKPDETRSDDVADEEDGTQDNAEDDESEVQEHGRFQF